MPKFIPLPKKTPEEIREWLFNDLMGQIEPDLTRENREATIRKLHAMPSDELRKTLTGYEEAFMEFIRRWPEYVKKTVRDLEQEEQKFKQIVSAKDRSDFEDIDRQISSGA